MPSMIQDSRPEPKSFSTLPFMSLAPGATPLRRPLEPAPVPATVPATCVPCPCTSFGEAASLKFISATTFPPARSGWVLSMPVSSTATSMPVPSNPAAHAAGAPICGTLSASAALTFSLR